MASRLLPQPWQGVSLVEAGAFIRQFSPKKPPRCGPRVVITDSPYFLRRLATARDEAVMHGWGLRFVQVDARSSVVLGHGSGASAVAMTLEILIELGAKKIFHLGTAASLQPEVEPAQVLVADAAYRDDGLSDHYLPPGDLVIGEARAAEACKNFLGDQGLTVRRGALWTTAALFRETAEALATFKARGALGVEMEAAAVMAVGSVRNVEVVCVRVISDRLLPSGWQPHFRDHKVREVRWQVLDSLVKEGQ